MQAVIVIDCRDIESHNFARIQAYPDTPEGNKEAETKFALWVQQAAGDVPVLFDDIEAALDRGIYEIGSRYVSILHTTGDD